MNKICSKCGESKPISKFNRDRSRKDGFASRCKACKKEDARDYYERNREAVIERERVRRASKSDEEKRDAQYRRIYGISLAEYDVMLEAQNGVCAICSTDTPGGKGRFVVDHCHTNGHVRKLLCNRCNLALGLVEDQPSLLAKMITYLGENDGTE